MSGWDSVTIHSAAALTGQAADLSRQQIEQRFIDFILGFMVDGVYVYRDRIKQSFLAQIYMIEVNLSDFIRYDEALAYKLSREPSEMIQLFESAALIAAESILGPFGDENKRTFPGCQITLKSEENITSLRDLNSHLVSRLIRVPGIVIGAQSSQSRATTLYIVCKNCQHSMRIDVKDGMSGITLPQTCTGPKLPNEAKDCGQSPYIVNHEKSSFVDQQYLKLQEPPDLVPVGELPRHIAVCTNRYLANLVQPGMRCIIVGIYSTSSLKDNSKNSKSGPNIGRTYLQAVGIELADEQSSYFMPSYSEEEEESFLEFSRTPDLLNKFSSYIAPSIFGNENIKKAVTCLLLGGSTKILPDGMKLRGDINVLLLGDPGTAKSQMLKFAERIAPVAVYTSGKGSSAAGLTASVQRDSGSREFYLEGGAMVLADGGVVCIDEFDKMREEDRVAIHEAMEQQTISIAKAGITTILNSRTSVLAAANPIFGRYDDTKNPGENIDFQTTILSRFDMIFIVKDEHHEAKDINIAKHVISVHKNDSDGVGLNAESDVPMAFMKKYINYARMKCSPRLSPDAADALSSHFVSIRKQIRSMELSSEERSTIPITIRQLEAIIRISESIAKLSLRNTATKDDVDNAMRLFLDSTMNAVGQDQSVQKEISGQMEKIETELRRRLPVGWSAPYSTLCNEFVIQKQYRQQALHKTIQMMCRKEIIQLRNQGKMVYRVKA